MFSLTKVVLSPHLNYFLPGCGSCNNRLAEYSCLRVKCSFLKSPHRYALNPHHGLCGLPQPVAGTRRQLFLGHVDPLTSNFARDSHQHLLKASYIQWQPETSLIQPNLSSFFPPSLPSFSSFPSSFFLY